MEYLYSIFLCSLNVNTQKLIKHKNTIGKVNLALFATSTTLAITGAGLPVAGAVNIARSIIAYPMALASGVSSRELIRSGFEDGDTNLNLDTIQKFLKIV